MKSVKVEIIEKTPSVIKAKLPFLEIPVTMNHDFFDKRIKNGYFKIANYQQDKNAVSKNLN